MAVPKTHVVVVRVLSDLKVADTVLSGDPSTPGGRLRVDVPSSFARLILMPAVPDFHRRYPGIQLDVGVSYRVVDAIGDNVDCVLRGGEVTVLSLVARRVGQLHVGMYAAPDYLRRAGKPEHPSDLQRLQHCIVGFPGVDTRRVTPWAGLRPMMPDLLPRVGRGRSANVFYNTGHGHLGWTLSAVTADIVAGTVAAAFDLAAAVAAKTLVSTPI